MTCDATIEDSRGQQRVCQLDAGHYPAARHKSVLRDGKEVMEWTDQAEFATPSSTSPMTELSPAETLTAAAERLKWLLNEDGMPEQIRGPWLAPREASAGSITAPGQEVPVAQAFWGGVAEYVVAVHPGVGLALADWLEATASEMGVVDGTEYRAVGDGHDFASWNAALAVARQLLGARP